MDTKPQPISPVVEQVAKAAERATDSPAEQERILSKPIDIVCFGRAGVGKTVLLEGLTGRDLGSTPRLGHGTTSLTAIELSQAVPLGDATKDVPIRFWDTKGIDEWNQGTLGRMFEELKEQNVNPLCAIYCASHGGRVEPQVVESILSYFHSKDVLVFYVVTNMYSGSDEQFGAQMDEGSDIMKRVTREEPTPRTKDSRLFGKSTVADVFSFGSKAHLLAVNSKPYANKRTGVSELAKNVDELMTLCVENMNEEKLVQYFIATLNNRDFWAHATDKLADALHYLSKNYHASLGALQRWASGVGAWLAEFVGGMFGGQRP